MTAQAAPRYSPGPNLTTNRRAVVARSTVATAVSTANRLAMPQVAAAADQLREVFSPVRVIFASEGGKELGREPPPGIKPVLTDAGAPKRTARKALRS